MARKCDITGKGVMSGNNVSHANNKTRRKFLPNIQPATLFSEKLNKGFKVKVTTAALRTVEHKGGLDAYVTGTAKTKLSPMFQKIKAQVEKAA